jgi:mandelamide amidase
MTSREGLCSLPAVEAVRAMREGSLRAEDYCRALLERAGQWKHLNAFITIDGERVLEAARAADLSRAAGGAMGLLHGLPLPVKDSVNTRALPASFRPYQKSGTYPDPSSGTDPDLDLGTDPDLFGPG